MSLKELAADIDSLLPQTQCTKCGYAGCRPYADAIASGVADINQCPPGGDSGVEAMARLLGREAKPLNPANGLYRPPQVAVIDEATCIGCTKCIQACPVDAIVGASKLMHTVIASWCTGCELCIPPCPVDCIVLEPVAALPDADVSRERFAFHGFRTERDARERSDRLAALE
ncbi:Ion-translocating oxidoreductase complex subunit B [Usitatibacter rugosus]|uniref:Ion-translocating oxidoreductase complex subunit B n=1 Tax=Usitatibacter rugosus TaxID=2732067 RepID=A0A6M4GWG4_9PROT|nr:RnfABCDGE type electron transport complex subunit B [Usitatibacter rugosus]QJR11641.1 Ion-translocating oxidoreductase complex subunit B [Usitatibacter rugosus]